MVSTSRSGFVIGGYNWQDASHLNVIAQFKDDAWSLYGNLQQPRRKHGSIKYGEKTMIIGGFTDDES